MEISRTLLETIMRINNSASKDETRIFLCGVHLLENDGKLNIEATDGHQLIRESSDFDQDLCYELTKLDGIILASTGIKRLKAFLAEYKMCMKFTFEVSEDQLKIMVGTSDAFILSTIKREYPKTASVIPTKYDNDNSISIGVNIALLHQVWKSMGQDKTRNGIVKMTVSKTNNLAPILINTTNKAHESIGVVMPGKIN